VSARKGHCPGCDRPVESGTANPWRPFCSERCKLADLGQWFAGRYAIPAEDEPPADSAAEPEPRQ
jgi:hypothetical protein